MSYVPNVMRAVNYIEQNLTYPITVPDIASVATYSTFHFVRLFKALTGSTPGSYLRRRRLTELRESLHTAVDALSKLRWTISSSRRKPSRGRSRIVSASARARSGEVGSLFSQELRGASTNYFSFITLR